MFGFMIYLLSARNVTKIVGSFPRYGGWECFIIPQKSMLNFQEFCKPDVKYGHHLKLNYIHLNNYTFYEKV